MRGHARSREVTGGHGRLKKAKNKLRIQETVILQLCLITSKSLTSKSLTSKSLTTLTFTSKALTSWAFTNKDFTNNTLYNFGSYK